MSIHCVSRNSISGFICEVFFCGFLMLARSQICADSKSCFHSGDPAFVATEDVATWAGMQGDILASLKLALGNPPNLRVLACMPISVFEAATSGWQISTGPGRWSKCCGSICNRFGHGVSHFRSYSFEDGITIWH